jgi:hypothetical protein
MDAPEMLSVDWWDGDDTMPATVGGMTPKSRQTFAHRRVDYLRDDINAADTIAALRADVDALKAGQGWQPIETAPKDGTAILLCGAGVRLGFWNGRSWDDGDFFNDLGDAFTHWMPIPTPPEV